MKTINVSNKIRISNISPMILIAGPCVIESEKQTVYIASKLKVIASQLRIPFIFKASYDKANRTSVTSYRGPGLEEGLRILNKVKKELNVPLITDVHCKSEVMAVSKVVDILQIPAFLSRQTDLIVECAKTQLPVNIKKGQFLAPSDMLYSVEKMESVHNTKILLTERGATFGYNNLVTDMRSLVIMKQTGYPVIFDATHSVQMPGGHGSSSGGQKEFIKPLLRAAIALGIAGVFIEVHPHPSKALSDGANSLSVIEVKDSLIVTKKIDRLIKNTKMATRSGSL